MRGVAPPASSPSFRSVLARAPAAPTPLVLWRNWHCPLAFRSHSRILVHAVECMETEANIVLPPRRWRHQPPPQGTRCGWDLPRSSVARRPAGRWGAWSWVQASTSSPCRWIDQHSEESSRHLSPRRVPVSVVLLPTAHALHTVTSSEFYDQHGHCVCADAAEEMRLAPQIPKAGRSPGLLGNTPVGRSADPAISA